MSYEKRKKNRKIRTVIGNSIVLIFFIYFLYNIVTSFFTNSVGTLLPQEELIIDGDLYESAIIKSETVYLTGQKIPEEYKQNEGQRVPTGYTIDEIPIIDKQNNIEKELINIETAIQLLEKEQTDIDNTVSDEDIIKNIQKNLSDLNRINEYKEQIFEGIDISVAIDSKYIGKNMEELIQTRDLLLEKVSDIEGSNNSNSGIISYNIDGLEEKYNPSNFQNINSKSIKEDKEELENFDNSEINGYKIMDNFNWYIGIDGKDRPELNDYQIGDIITTVIGDNERELIGKIVDINSDNIYFIMYTDYFEDYYNDRFQNIKVVTKKEDGYKIPTKTVIKYDGQYGVYIKKFNGIVSFRNIDIIKEDKEYTYISKGTDGYIELNGEKVRTVSAFDEILMNPSGYSEGEIID